MKKVLFTLAAILGLSLALVATSCGGGGGSDDDDETPVAGSGSTGGSGRGGTGGGSTSPSVPDGFVLVQGATFNGAITVPDSQVFIEGHTVIIPNLLVCDHEVTQGEYKQYCTDYPDIGPCSPYGVGDNYPAYNVSWYDALVYCNKRSIAENLAPCYKIKEKTNPSDWGSVPISINSTWDAAECDFAANGYRLPTEAEWEYLARGGNLTNSGQFEYSGSNEVGDVAWYKENAYAVGSDSPDYGTHQVKQKLPNSKGLYDMSGNVLEMCWTKYGSNRIFRGGCWYFMYYGCTVYDFGWMDPSLRDYLGGFRVVRSRSE